VATGGGLQAENDVLREQVEAYRHRELADLRDQLAVAKADASHYRAEAERNAGIGRQIHAESQAEIARLRDRVQTLEGMPNARTIIRPA